MTNSSMPWRRWQVQMIAVINVVVLCVLGWLAATAGDQTVLRDQVPHLNLAILACLVAGTANAAFLRYGRVLVSDVGASLLGGIGVPDRETMGSRAA